VSLTNRALAGLATVSLALIQAALGAIACGGLAGACGPSKPAAGPPPAPVQIADADAQLVGSGLSSCTNQIVPSGDGDRWCGFSRGAADGSHELWVIDVTTAARGGAPRCDGTDSGCLLLTRALWPRSAPLFDGDTLIYETDSVSAPTADFLGRVWAWRPGWTHGRQISSDRGFLCIGQRASAAAACFDEPAGDPAKRDSAQVRVGTLDGEAGGPLPIAGRWPLRTEGDPVWEAAFAPDGAHLALMSAPAVGDKQNLVVLPTAAAASASTAPVLDDVAHAKIANDARAIYFVRGLPDRADLYVADFPSGAGARLVDEGVLSYARWGQRPTDQALGYVKDLGGTKREYKLILDRARGEARTIFAFEDIFEGAVVSPDLRYTAWLDSAFRGVVVRNDDLASCQLDLDDEPPVFEPVFLDRSSLLFWKEIRPADNGHRDAFYADPGRCRPKTRLADDVAFMVPVGDRGLVYGDELDATTGRVSLEVVAVAPGGATLDAAGPVRVQAGVELPVVFVGPAPPLLVYRASGGSAGPDGIFVYGPAPL
jgi:hypothetical protein